MNDLIFSHMKYQFIIKGGRSAEVYVSGKDRIYFVDGEVVKDDLETVRQLGLLVDELINKEGK